MRKLNTSLLIAVFCCCTVFTHSQTVGIMLNSEKAFNGYTLFNAGPSLAGSVAGNSTTYLVNNCGEVVNFWRSQYNAGLSCYLDYNGNLIRPIMNRQSNTIVGPGGGGGVEIIDWEGNVVWNFDYNESGLYLQHHDIEPLPNGNVLIIAWEKISPENAAERGRNGTLVTEHIVEVKPNGAKDGEIVWKWRAFDHMVQDIDNTLENYGQIAKNPQLIDINLGNSTDQLHFNSIDYIEEFDLILLSSRFLNEIYIIDHSTTTEEAASHTGGTYGKGGDILYRWGNSVNYDIGTTVDRKIKSQHGVSWVPTAYNNKPLIAIFNNNGEGGASGGSNISYLMVIEPPINPDGSFDYIPDIPYRPEKALINQQVASAQTGSNCTGLPNGNFLYCVNQNGEIGEISPTGELVWQYIIPTNQQGPVEQGQMGRSSSFNAEKYAPDFIGFKDKDLTAKDPVERNPFENDCMIFDGTAPSASFTHSSFDGQDFTFIDNSTGAINSWIWDFGDGNSSALQNPLYQFETSGDYNVCLTIANSVGQDTYCEMVTATIINNIEQHQNGSLAVYPQPASDYIYISQTNLKADSFSIINIAGTKVMSGAFKQQLNVANLAAGVYIIQFTMANGSNINQKILIE